MKQCRTTVETVSKKDPHESIQFSIDLIEYMEDDIYYVYSPALDLVGYGINEKEALSSWEVVLEEYLTYSVNEKTLITDLEKHGWQIAPGQNKIISPTLTWLLQHNPDLNNIYNN